MAPVETSNSQLKELPSLVMASQPGFLTLPPSRAKELIAQDPLDRWYTVDNQPFARGKFAAVKRCRHAETGEVFAAKVIRKRRRGAGLTAESLHEAATLDLCRSCPHIVRLEQVFDAPGETVLVLQLAEGGELQSVLDRDEVPEERDVIRFLSQVLGGLAFLHQFDIAHLDLKPQNLVLTGPFPNCDIKLCDFGIARHIARGADVREILGTPDYVAPEVLNYEPISLATDMWSVGVLAYVLLTGCTPFGGDSKQETFCNITRCQLEFPDDLFHDVSPSAIQFISSLLVQDPSARLSAKQCLEHPWLRGGSSVDSIPTVVSSSEDSCPVSRSSTIVPDDDDDDVANSFHDEALEAEPAAVVAAATTPPAQQAAVESPKVIPATSQVATFSTPTARRMESKSKLCVLSEDVSCQQVEPQQPPQEQPATQSPPAATHSSSNFNLPVTRRAGSLPSYRWRASTSASTNATTGNSRREASCDRASDLGYGSDGVSEISSTDSSSDRSSIISLEDSPLEWNNPSGPRRYSDTSLAAERLWRRTWERFLPATAGTCVSLPYHLYRDQQPPSESSGRRLSHQPTSLTSVGRSGGSIRESDATPISDDVDSSPRDHHRPWEKVCTGSLARALERFNSPPPSSNGAPAEVNGSKSSVSNGPPASSLTSPVLKSAPVKVSEVRTRLLRGSASGQTQSQNKVGTAAASLTIKAPLLHLDKTEIVKSRLVKFRTAQAATATPLTHHPASAS